jgi:hypothetical protein
LSGKLRRIFDVAFTVLARRLDVTHIVVVSVHQYSVGYAPQNARVWPIFSQRRTIGAAGAILVFVVVPRWGGRIPPT